MFFALQAQYKSDKYPDIVAKVFVSDYYASRDTLFGGEGINYPIRMDINKILGENKRKWFVSLPKGSYVILQFTDNEIVDAPKQNDIVVIEHGCCQEFASIHVSHDGDKYEYLGTVDDCDNNELDLATIGFTQSVRFIKIEGLDVKCSSPGFDLVSVYGIGEANVNLYATMEEVDTFFETDKTETTLILDNIYFETDSYIIKEDEVKDLQVIIEQLNKYPKISISISGHTDSRASEKYNKLLSLSRAKSVKEYLIRHGIERGRIEIYGFGESQPLRTNLNEEGRAINRRVELRRLN